MASFFLPLAISLVGASVIWQFVYAWQPAGQPQIGLLNAVVVGLGGEPLAPDGATAPPPAFADGRRLLFPTGDVYATYIADPHRVTSALTFQFHSHSDIEGTNGTRF